MNNVARAILFSMGCIVMTAFASGSDLEKINYRKLRKDEDGSYRKNIEDNFKRNSMTAFPLADPRLMDANLVRKIELNLEDDPEHASAIIHTIKLGHEKNIKMMEYYTDEDGSGDFTSNERTELDFFYFDGAYKAATNKVHKIQIAAEFENGAPDIVTYDESAEIDGDDWSVRKTFQSDPVTALQKEEGVIVEILLDPIKAMQERRKTTLGM